ncbi:hypothetical protein ACFRR6_24550 [Streptomyces sp. NPDC056891]|uniref:hypothetical protein n=1 Tax=Streptomyces sp. NPDC056891 TaxID=3345961 RepID=UPI0036CEBED9
MKVTTDGIPQIANVDDFNAALADSMAELGVDETTAEHFLYLNLGMNVVHPKDSAEHVFTPLFNKAVETKEGWATTWLAAEHRPAYERALEVGIHPISALQLTTDMGPKAARETVNRLKAESEANQ